jgi:DNA-binding NtrC family response regulator
MKDKILYIDDEQSNLDVFKVSFMDDFEIFTSQSTREAYDMLVEEEIKVVLIDQRMPEETGIEFINRVGHEFQEVVFMILSAYADFDVAHDAIKTGKVYRFLLKPWKENEMRIDMNNAIEKYNLSLQNKTILKSLEVQNKKLTALKKQLEEENQYFREEIKLSKNFEDIITEDERFLSILKNIEQVASSDAPVLITGETGTGKELVARAIHNLSDRRHRAFVCINCAAIPESLYESELFGHEKGAFTGAIGLKKGKFELADGGTLFLDEVGEIPVHLQAKLLRAIQENQIERVGGKQVIDLDIRVVSATNRMLQEEVNHKRFRSDLFYRINVFPITIPPLRERKKDIPLLVQFFINKFNQKYSKTVQIVSRKEMERIKMYDWPGNVRELENTIERGVITSLNNQLNMGHLIPVKSKTSEPENIQTLEEVERDYILSILAKTNWKIGGKNGAAEYLGLNRTTLIARMKKLQITRPDK